VAHPRHSCPPSRVVGTGIDKGLMHCPRQNGQERQWFETAEDAEAFRNLNPAYSSDIIVLCGRCGFYHCSNPEWLVERLWETPVKTLRVS
jgi:hypothetical protein